MSEHEILKAEKKTVTNLYALMAVSILLTVVPHIAAGVLSLIFFAIAMGKAYKLRKSSEAHSLGENHATYIVRTIWISLLWVFVFTVFGSIYVFFEIDPLPLQACMNAILDQAGGDPSNMDAANIALMLEPCMANFLEMNRGVFIAGLSVSAVPALLYIAYRFIKGLSRAGKGYRLADPKGWF